MPTLRTAPRLLLASLTLGLLLGLPPAQADSPNSAPGDLKTALAEIDEAANSKNLQGVLQYYSSTFTDGNGLNRSGLEQNLTALWKRFPKLTYRTELQSWKREGAAIVAETITTMKGNQVLQGRTMTLQATIRSLQYVENNHIFQQSILSERSQLTSGTKPPTVVLNLPEKVKAGQEFQFDAIVKEPLGDGLLLGGVYEKPVSPQHYLEKLPDDLDLLTAGGVFKVGKAPTTPQDLWISAVFIRQDGMNLITQRLQVVSR
ncbi:hypothetical protein DO97_04190 [Neosynechococcus sphagnicola sy1]|uniref:SnoaL-like domain-containing protein n=1 Tax=Neosynechococcus sphagnicola sy1 TaxID=1497020 RepID=A0A098TKT7_9CYAN|nr:hypothetical protein DO97_04190 [Neosynechococcus sphagnicola sy1]